MSQVNESNSGLRYWRSLEQLAESPEVLARLASEFPGYDPEALKGTSRRRFMKLMGASMALAGLTLNGCRRWPKEEIVPQTTNVEGRVPGISEQYATVMELGGVGVGLLATCYGGRPIKLEGNPLHPFARVNDRHGSADAIAQASVLELYDPDRSRSAWEKTSKAYRKATVAEFIKAIPDLVKGTGAGVALLSEASEGPSALDMKKRVMAKFPQLRWYEYEPISHDNERLATQMACGQTLRTNLHLDKADVVFALDADLLGTHPAHMRYAADWSTKRRTADGGEMSRVYVAESAFTITGAVADHRLPVRLSRLAAVACALAAKLGVAGVAAAELKAEEEKFVAAAAEDLKKANGAGVVAAGTHLAPEVQALALAMNQKLGAFGTTIELLPVAEPQRASHAKAIGDLAMQLQDGAVQTLIILGGNPAYDAPADLKFGELIAKVPASVHLSVYRNETSGLCTWHIPRAHYLEAWGDARAWDGTVSVAQPMIEPLFGGLSAIEFLAAIAGDSVRAGHDIVKRALEPMLPNEQAFRRAMHDGVVAGSAAGAVKVEIKTPQVKPAAESTGLEARFVADASVYDGRFANLGWLQEMPDPLTKLTWDNAALVSPADAKHLGIGTGDVVKITAGGQSLEIVAFVLPGQPIGMVTLPLGYGRSASGNIGQGLGFDTYKLRTSGEAAVGVQVAAAGRKYPLSTTQDHHIIDEIGIRGRTERVGEKHESGSIVRQTTLEGLKHGETGAHAHHGPVGLQLFEPPNAFKDPHAWGMSVDMTACIGCNACVVACQAENNIPVVGKIEVSNSRAMHWIRIDRYFKGEADDPNPEVAFQPMMCVHCENAPCEQVCPVAATVHDTEGLNTMIYNRCIGTRYCSNNCPYKVRRFNYFDYQSKDPRGGRFPAPWLNMPDTEPLEKVDDIKRMVFNPDVTVRMRGVMEKCTYCVQRIQGAKIRAKNEFLAGQRDSEIVRDGEVITACEQACPTQAITFGNLNDRDAWVTKLHQLARSYGVLHAELNTRPRTQYLAKVRNPSEALESPAKEHAAKEAEHA